MKKITTYLSAAFFMILSFVGASVALAQTDADLAALAKPVLAAVLGGDYMYGAALGLVLGVALLRRFGGAKYPWLASKDLAPYLVLLGSFGAALATSLSAGAAITGGMAWGAIRIAIAASGSYAMLKPALKWLEKKAPAWMSPLFALTGWVFDSKSRAKKAREAGEAAVKASPAEGAKVDFHDFL